MRGAGVVVVSPPARTGASRRGVAPFGAGSTSPAEPEAAAVSRRAAAVSTGGATTAALSSADAVSVAGASSPRGAQAATTAARRTSGSGRMEAPGCRGVTRVGDGLCPVIPRRGAQGSGGGPARSAVVELVERGVHGRAQPRLAVIARRHPAAQPGELALHLALDGRGRAHLHAERVERAVCEAAQEDERLDLEP